MIVHHSCGVLCVDDTVQLLYISHGFIVVVKAQCFSMTVIYYKSNTKMSVYLFVFRILFYF